MRLPRSGAYGKPRTGARRLRPDAIFVMIELMIDGKTRLSSTLRGVRQAIKNRTCEAAGWPGGPWAPDCYKRRQSVVSARYLVSNSQKALCPDYGNLNRIDKVASALAPQRHTQ